MRTLDETIELVNKFNSNILKKGHNLSTTLFLDSEETKSVDVFCNDQDYYIEDSQNLSQDEESEIEELLLYLHNYFKQSAAYARMCDATDNYLYNN